MNNFQLHMQAFDQFIEDTTDRLQLIIHDDVQLIFMENMITLRLKETQIAILCYNKLYPTLNVNMTFSKSTLHVLKNLSAHSDELLDIMKLYTMMLMQSKKPYDTKAIVNEDVQNFMNDLQTINTKRQSYTGMKFLVRTHKDNSIYITIKDYGGPKKINVTLEYSLIVKGCDEKIIGSYSINKELMLEDLAYQIVTGKISHKVKFPDAMIK